MHRYGTLSRSIGGGGGEDQRMRRNARHRSGDRAVQACHAHARNTMTIVVPRGGVEAAMKTRAVRPAPARALACFSAGNAACA